MPSEQSTQTWVASEIESMALFHENIQAWWTISNEIKPAVRNGVVSLEGFAVVASAIATINGGQNA